MRGDAVRALVPALVVLGLVGVVAVASTGSTSTGSSEKRPPAEIVLDTFFSLWLVLFVVAAGLVVWALLQQRQVAAQLALSRRRRVGLLAFAGLAAAFVFAYFFGRTPFFTPPATEEDPPLGEREIDSTRTTADTAENTYEPEFAWIPVLVLVGLAIVAVGAHRVAAHRRRRGFSPRESGVAEDLVDLLGETLDDLRAEGDPRRAVIAAYARLERMCAAHGLPRAASETPEEYLARLQPELALDASSLRRLTDLFTRAKFSPHEVDAGMKEDAIDALSAVRDELRAAEARRVEAEIERLQAVAERS